MKLVRDKIPSIIEADGQHAVWHTAEHDELTKALREKLEEEVSEFLETPCEEEVADILEVLHGLCNHYGFSWHDVQDELEKKRAKKGGYDAGTILDNVKK